MATVEREIRSCTKSEFYMNISNLRWEMLECRAETRLGDNVVLHQMAGVEREAMLKVVEGWFVSTHFATLRLWVEVGVCWVTHTPPKLRMATEFTPKASESRRAKIET